MITLSVHTSCRHLGNARACLGNIRGLLYTVAAKPFFISMAHDPWRAMGHMSALEPSSEVGRGLEPMDACQHRSPPRRRGGVQCRGMCGSAGALLDGEAGFGAS
jgi:hypothetical protein